MMPWNTFFYAFADFAGSFVPTLTIGLVQFTVENFNQMSVMALGAVAGFLASLIGWQINIVAIHRGLERDTRTGAFFIGMGAALADVVFIFIAFTGAAPFLHRPGFWNTIKWVGIVTIFLVAARIFFCTPEMSAERKKKKRDPAKNLLVGFLLVISNPAVFLVWLGVIGFLLTQFREIGVLAHRWLFIAGFFGGAALWFTILSFGILHGARNWEDDKLYLLSKISAVILLIIGIFLIFQRF